ncbi:MAG: hypothetical protein L0Y44_00635 [Phycisphaerales bacterium]|nr:hypothetical protein [Phycisphaerales bacterium]MCI0629143.1 hypothetical protein [Phycisphaerales bacterium]MCI0676719.1 hypothetical protein [Phycisphaerales bacterium]
MRGSGWALVIVPAVAWLACVCFPALALGAHLFQTSHSEVQVRTAWELLLTSAGWATAVALGSCLVGWLPGRLLGRVLGGGGFGGGAGFRGFVALGTLFLAPMCLPSYIVFFAWWQSWPADTALHRWIVANEFMPLARQLTLYVGLLCWSWPLVSWCVARAVAAIPAEHDELLQLDGAGPATRLADAFRSDFKGLLLGALLVFLATLNNTTCFDLAQVFTFANELRAIEVLNAGPRDVLIAGAPMIVIAFAGGLLVWTLTAGRPREMPHRSARPHAALFVVSLMIWLASVALPLVLFAANIGTGRRAWDAMVEFFQLYRFSAMNTVALAAVSGALGSTIAIGFVAAWQDHRRWINRLANVAGLSWLIMALLPATMIGVALEAAYNREGLAGAIYANQLIVVLGHLASFGFVAVLLGRWIAASEPHQLLDLRQLDGAQTLTGTLNSTWPRLLGGGGAVLVIMLVLSVGEIPVTAKVNPPVRVGYGPLALALLNDMHYQRPQTVMVAAIGMMVAALGAAAAVAVAWTALERYRLIRR